MASDSNFYSLIERRFPSDLDSACIETADGLVYSWNDLHHASGRLAHWLDSLRLPAGARVAVQVEKSPECLMLYLATLRAGLVYLPLNTAYQQAEIEYFLADAEPDVLVCTPARLAELEPLARRARCRHVVTLGEARDGSLLDAAVPFADAYSDPLARGRRPRGDPVHVGHDRAQQGGHADARQSGVQRPDARRVLGLCGCARGGAPGCAVACAAPVSCAWPVRRIPCCAARRRAEPCSCRSSTWPRCSTACRVRPYSWGCRRTTRGCWRSPPFDKARCKSHTALHLRVRTAARRNAPRVRGAHRAPHPRALRHVGNRHAGVEPLLQGAGLAHRRHGGAAAAGRRCAGRARGRHRLPER